MDGDFTLARDHGAPPTESFAIRTEILQTGLARLRSLHESLESAFLGLGEQLGFAQRKSLHLTAMARALAARLNEAEFLETVAGLDRSLEQVAALRRDSGDDACLDGIALAASTVRKQLQTLLKVMSQLSMLGINAKIEAAQVNLGTVDFSLFTHEIRHLSQSGQSSVADVLAQLEALANAVRQAIEGRRDLAQQQAEELGELVGRLSTSITAVRVRQQDAAKALNHLPTILEGSATAIAGAVIGLQFGDIARQRLEHVETALGVLSRIVAGDTADIALEGNVGAFVAAVCDLEIDQLKYIEEDFRRNAKAAVDGLTKVAHSVDDIRTLTEKVYRSGVDGGSTFLLDIDKDLERAAQIMLHYGEVAETTQACLTEVNGRVGAINTSMAAIHDVDANMNLIGLNASIKCGNIGFRGRALNVIALELRAAARQTAALAGDIARQLNSIVEQTGTLAKDGADGDSLQTLRQSLFEAAERLRHSGGETAWVMSQIQDDARTIVGHVQSGTSRFTIGDQMRDTVTQAISELRQLADAAAPTVTAADIAHAKERFLSFMQSHYTMDIERLIHHGAKPPSPTAAPSAAAVDDLSDILF